MGIEGTYLNIIKAIYKKTHSKCHSQTVNYLKAFSLKLGKRGWFPLSPVLFNIILEVLAMAMREGKGLKWILIRKGLKRSLFSDDMILYREYPKHAPRKLLELINEFGKVAGYKLICKNLAFLSEKAMETHSNTLAWKIPWAEEPGWLQSVDSLCVGHNWVTSLSLFNFYALEKEMATHSSVLAWRIPGTGEPRRLPAMGSHRVGQDWSDLAAAAAGIPVH